MGGRFRKIAGVTVALVFGFLPTGTLAGPVMIWSTGFEDGFPPGVSATGNWRVITSEQSAHSGLRGADIAGSTGLDGDVLSLPMSSAGYQNLGLEYWFKVREGLEEDDQVLVQWTVNGTNWETFITYANQAAGDWQLATFDLPVSADNNPAFALRLLANLDSGGDRMNVDDLALTGQVVPEPATLGLLSLGAFAGVCRRRFW